MSRARSKRLIRDRDSIFGSAFDARVTNLGVHQMRSAPRSPRHTLEAEPTQVGMRDFPPGLGRS
jgi:hypothetical protein